MDEMAIADDGGGLRVGFTAGTFFSQFYGPPTVERLEFLFRHEKQWIGDRPQFIALALIDPRVGKEMNAAARHKAREISDHWGKRMVVSVTVVEGSGFFPALVRGVVTSIQLVSRVAGVDIAVASSIDEGVRVAARAARNAGLPADEAVLAAALRRLSAAAG